MISLILLSIVLFVGTHIDDLVLLISFFSAHAASSRSIVLGQYIGVTALLMGSLLCAEIAVMVPQHYLRFLGLVPLLIGLGKIPTLFRTRMEDDEGPFPAPTERRVMGSVAALTLASGGDNIGVYLPFFATHPARARWIVIVVFLAMTAVWCAAARWLAHHRVLEPLIRRWGAWILPLVLIALGIRILSAGH